VDNKKIAIFSTSDLHSQFAPGPFVAEFTDDAGGSLKFKSYGVLEAALANNYIVYVVPTRPRLHDVDNWWLQKVGASNVFLAQGESTFSKDASNLNPCIGWKALYSELDLNWPLEEDGTDAFWTTAKAILYSHHNYKSRNDFKEVVRFD